MAEFTQERLGALNAAYARCIDNDEVEAWPAFFQERCLYVINTAENHAAGMQAGVIYADTRAMLRDRVSALREANVYERHRYRHIVGLPFMLGVQDGVASVETPFLVVRIMRDGATEVFASGRYQDRVVEGADGQLSFAERLVICDSRNFDTLLAIPL
ncbi:nuclear transport factor 2 family protein [Pigmentiphaga sp. GD03639]|jgi:3-phenylpropionate/cinnamic acid dioxygenase small subunit|uniref:Aromatic-ring-hydroxylating dioxygenase subunit beta n=1 Tax=Pigmentiphaga daeguensis TaxID=414049 RepID=A0ABN1CY43_9BURK|nr:MULTISPECIES: aromatic-ring-hydroxylating dioxygenase subunit beta [unclassified Pigmentiphaga]MDH2238701.1 nuclear transport factor 2 family protein [Pigmentiphaga sp. GD03639]OVZ58952.1 terephthalate 1,2-dioxygenase [Pigmentiphaga sp. NML030171]